MSTDSKKIVLAFDLYGTLLSTESIAKQLATYYGDAKSTTIAALWRRYQLEYTWRMNSMGIYKPFSDITLASLKHAVAESSESLNKDQSDALMQSYNSLSTFPDVPPALSALSSSSDIDAYIFSNGSHSMVSASVSSSPSLSPFASVFSGVVTVDDEECHVFKPDPRVYHYLAAKVGKQGRMDEMWLISGNPFDVVGALRTGMRAAWVDRSTGREKEERWKDALGGLVEGAESGPTVVVGGVDEVVEAIRKWAHGHEFKK